MNLSVGEHYIVKLFGMDVHMDTLITLWIAMGIILFFAILSVSKINILPNKVQAVFENILGSFVRLTTPMGKEQGNSALILMCLFLLIIVSNLVGQLPFKLIHLPKGELAAPTNDLNTTLALALFVVIYYIYKGVKAKGIKYFEHYFKPVWFMTPFNIMEDFIRPLTLSVRLFANILAGEILIMVLGALAITVLNPQTAQVLIQKLTFGLNLPPILSYDITAFFGSFMPLPVMFFELFVAFIQALVFTLLANSYIKSAVAKSH